MTLKVTPIPAFYDNYIWMIESHSSSGVAVVDPGDATAVLNWLHEQKKSLNHILITHKHPDHIGGVDQLVKQTSAKVYAPKQLQLLDADVRLQDGDNISIFEQQWQIFSIPGHTLEHIMYYSSQQSMAFVGDTIFAAGCGRIFEGTPEQMYQTLLKIISLPDETVLYPAHEYTLANLRFALDYDPDNQALHKRYEQVERLRSNNQPSLPTSVAEEKATNPFCRARQLRDRVEALSQSKLEQDWQVFAWLRKTKDLS